jgi:hypothetical protein
MLFFQDAQRAQALPSGLCAEIERHVRAAYLSGMPDGPRSFAIIVRAVRGTVPPAFANTSDCSSHNHRAAAR